MGSPLKERTLAHGAVRALGRGVVLLPIVILSALFLRRGVFGGPDALLGRAGWDMPILFYPQRLFAVERLRQGEFPLWNPLLFGGLPFHGSAHPALLYPPNLLALALPAAAAFNVLAALHVALAGALTYGLLREVGVRAAAALFGAVAFAFSARPLLHASAGHAPLLATLAWLPGTVWLAERAWRRDRARAIDAARDGVALAIVFALSLLAGYPQYAAYGGLAAAALAAARLAGGARRGDFRRGARRALVVLGGLAGGVALAAAQVLPALDVASRSFRRSAPPDFLAMGFLPIENLATLLVPSALGDARTAPYFGQWSYWNMCLHAGGATVAFAALALASGREGRRRARPWLWLAATSLLVALGRQTPLFEFVARLPLLGAFRGISKMSAVVLLAIAVLAGLGLEALLSEREATSGRRGRVRRRGLAILATLCAIGLGIVWSTSGDGGARRVARLYGALASPNEDFPAGPPVATPALVDAVRGAIARDAGRLSLCAALLACATLLPARAPAAIAPAAATLILACDLFLTFDPMLTALSVERDVHLSPEVARAVRETPPLARFGAAQWRENRGTLYGAAAIGGWEGNVPERIFAFSNFLSERPLDAPVVGLQPARLSPLFDLLVLQRLILDGPAPIDDAFRPVASGTRFVAYDRLRPLPRAFLAHEVVVAPDRAGMWESIRNGRHDPYAVATVERREDAEAIEPAADEPAPEVRLAGANHVVVRARPASRALLVLLDAYDPGWRARVDGRPARIVPVFGVFRGVYLDAGDHEVRFAYAPRSFTIGVILSLSALVAAVVIFGRGSARAR